MPHFRFQITETRTGWVEVVASDVLSAKEKVQEEGFASKSLADCHYERNVVVHGKVRPLL